MGIEGTSLFPRLDQRLVPQAVDVPGLWLLDNAAVYISMSGIWTDKNDGPPGAPAWHTAPLALWRFSCI